jgi:putative transposase
MAKQLEFPKTKGWGGQRRGAGRPNRSGEVSHLKRENVDLKKPLHITMRLKPRVASLRNRHLLREMRNASQAGKRLGLYIVHFSLLNNHLHMIVETRNNSTLANGMRGFGSKFGKAIRKLTGGMGSVFAGRFHMHVLKTPSEVKGGLEYVLLNYAKHRKLIECIDGFSSAFTFKPWRELLRNRYHGVLDEYGFGDWDELSLPQSWLLRIGWQRAR